jgi:hypothetical protein
MPRRLSPATSASSFCESPAALRCRRKSAPKDPGSSATLVMVYGASPAGSQRWRPSSPARASGSRFGGSSSPEDRPRRLPASRPPVCQSAGIAAVPQAFLSRTGGKDTAFILGFRPSGPGRRVRGQAVRVAEPRPPLASGMEPPEARRPAPARSRRPNPWIGSLIPTGPPPVQGQPWPQPRAGQLFLLDRAHVELADVLRSALTTGQSL